MRLDAGRLHYLGGMGAARLTAQLLLDDIFSESLLRRSAGPPPDEQTFEHGDNMNNTAFYAATGLIPIALALTSFGCATKGYVKAQVAPVDAKTAALDTKTTELADKHQTDVSRLEEKILTTDYKVNEVTTAAQQANASAATANQTAQQNKTAIEANDAANKSAIAANNASIAALDKAMTYSLVAKGDVTFAFDKSNLGKVDQAGLDTLIAQSQSMPRVQVELIGFTDRVGSADYNFALSRRRSESVARYLVRHGVPLQGIHIIGLGEEPVPPGLLADAQAVDPNATDANSRRLARRVLIRIYSANAGVQSASLQ
jgi:outer membrane protein OmpA-like peptidoglycan-associated protein